MLYHAYQGYSDFIEPARAMARTMADNGRLLGDWLDEPMPRRGLAIARLLGGSRFTHIRPDFGIREVLSGNELCEVREMTVLSLPFCDLLHFSKDNGEVQPKMLLITPLSGHFSTLLRNTVATMLRDHDVYVTDWRNARDVPLSAGQFGFDDYVDYLIRFFETLGPGTNVTAVCQPCVQAIAATAIMAEDNHPAQPATLTLMGGPVDTRVSPTAVNEMATTRPLKWFRENMIATVPWQHPGGGRQVYPGFLQLSAFMSMNSARHIQQHQAMYQHYADGEIDKAEKIKDFYNEYFAVLDLTAEFYLETIDKVFQRSLLATGELTYRGDPVRPAAIRKTALLTVEGERDDICAVGQTAAAHDLCSTLRPHLKRHHLQPGVGHYGVFSGSKWERQIYPQIRSLVLAMA